MGVIHKETNTAEVQDSLLESHDTEKDTEKAKEKAIEEDNEGVPTDSGFAWVIVISVFLMMTVIIGFNRSLSVLFLDISEEYQERATTVSLMFTLHSLSSSVSSIVVSNIIMSKVSVRSICVVAAVVNSLISILLSVAPNIVIFLLLFVLKGIFFGALLVAPMSLIGFYFKKRRSLASSFATAGMCVAFIIFPPLTEALRVEFSMRGSFLVIAAVELHLVACSLLLRPVESYITVYKSRQKIKQFEEEKMRQLSPIYKGPEIEPAVSEISSQTTELAEEKLKEDDTLLTEVNGKDHVSDITDELQRNRSRSDASYHRLKHEDLTSIDIKYTPSSSPMGYSSLNDLEISLSYSRENMEKNKQARKRSITFERQKSHLSAISMTELPYIVPEIIEEYSDEARDRNNKRKTMFSRLLNTFIDVSLFKIWRFRMMTVFIPLSVFANYTIIYMPVICTSINISPSDGAFLMTLSGLMDLVTRFITGFIGDFKFVSKPKLVALSTFVVGTVCQCTRFFTTYSLFIVYAVLVGVFGGIRQNFFHVMLMDFVGVEKMGKAYGLASTLATLTLSVNHPVVAALYDVTKGFVIPLHYVGTMVYLGTLVLLLEPIFCKLDEKNIVPVKNDGKAAVKVPGRQN